MDSISGEQMRKDPLTKKIRKYYAVQYAPMVLLKGDIHLMTNDELDWFRWVKKLVKLPCGTKYFVEWKVDLEWASKLKDSEAVKKYLTEMAKKRRRLAEKKAK